MINILIVEDSETEQAILKNILAEDPDLNVVGWAKNGEEALRLIPLLKPHLVTMDILMPIMDGLETTRRIMTEHPLPIVIISSQVAEESKEAYEALNAGALSVLLKPINITSPTFAKEKKRFITTIKSMAEIKVIRRRPRRASALKKVIPHQLNPNYKIICMGASIGGTQALKEILSHLEAPFPLPIVVVQHIMPGFISGFSEWLNDTTALAVKTAEHSEILRANTVYFAPDHCHFEIKPYGRHLQCNLVKNPPVCGFCPSITQLFHTVADACGPHAIGLLLTGMGNDGSEGLLRLKEAGAHTLIQDAQSAVVFGMAKIAQTMGAVDRVVNLENIAEYLTQLTKK